MNTRGAAWQLVWAFVLAAVGLGGAARAQITPERMYYGVDKRIIVQVDAPGGLEESELEIRLHDPVSGGVLARSAAVVGRADLGGLLPVIWEEKSGLVRLAQLYAGDVAIGAPLVVQPLVTPNAAMLVDPQTMQPSGDPRATVMFEDERLAAGGAGSAEREVTYSGVRLYLDQEVVIETTEGDIVFRMRPDAAPNTVFNFLHLVNGGFYTDVIVHRVVAALKDGRPFVWQFGDLSGTGSGGPGYAIDLERGGLKHGFGVLSMARGPDPNSNGSQVFVCLSRAGTALLDGRYTAFAEAVSGADVIRAIAAVEVGAGDRPVQPPVVVRAYLRDGPALGVRKEALWEVEASVESGGAGPSAGDAGR